MVDISLITSLYRSDAHLSQFTSHVLRVATAVQAAGLSVEFILVANDPTNYEREFTGRLAALLGTKPGITANVITVERETLYASWNRGVRAASGRCVGFWNVDDVRTAEALIECRRLVETGIQIVDFPFTHVLQWKRLGLFPAERHRHIPAQYDPARIHPRTGVGPFFMFARSLYEQAGPFDEHFRVVGDFEWSVREVVRSAPYARGTALGGTFVQHGDNLSGSQASHEWVEHNTILLRHAQWDAVRPVDPDLMRSCWFEWGDTGIAVPDHVADMLWGAGAAAAWQSWQRAERRKQWSRTLRTVPRFVIDRTGLRSFLARIGVVKAAGPRER
jgi:hypothetical protein